MVQFLASLGFSENEAKLYIASLSLGHAAVSTITKRAGINRTTGYTILEELVQKGFVHESYRGSTRYYSALDPESLVDIFRRRIAKVEKMLPELQAMNGNLSTGPKVRYYQGLDEVKQLYIQELKDSPEEMYIFDSGVDRKEDKLKLREFAVEFIKKIVPKRLKIIGNYPPRSTEEKNTERKILTKSELLLPALIKIYGNKVHFISLKNNLFGVEIENEDIATCLKELFHYIWKK